MTKEKEKIMPIEKRRKPSGIIFSSLMAIISLLAGIYLIRTKKIKKGEIIKISEIEGRILEVNLLETKIETNNKEILFIPNSTITRKVVKIIKK